MKKLLFGLVFSILFANVYSLQVNAQQPEPMVTVQIPTEKIETSKSSKAVDATKNATKKSVEATKDFTNKAVNATKKATKKSVDATKDFTGKTVENAKDVIDNMNPNKPVTLEGLEGKAEIKTLKNERNELKAAYNSRIKDINAKVKATEKSTNMTEVQKQHKIYTLNKEKAELLKQRNDVVKKYNLQIKQTKERQRRGR